MFKFLKFSDGWRVSDTFINLRSILDKMGEVKVVESLDVVVARICGDLINATRPLFPGKKVHYAHIGMLDIHDIVLKTSFFRSFTLYTVHDTQSAFNNFRREVTISVAHQALMETAQRVAEKYKNQLEEITLVKNYTEQQARPSAQPASA